MGVGFGLSALNVKYRDFRYVIPFIVQFGIFASPVFYTSGWFREKHGEVIYQLYRLNPMVGVIDGVRWAIGGDSVVMDWTGILISIVVTAGLLVVGLRYFRATEENFADII